MNKVGFFLITWFTGSFMYGQFAVYAVLKTSLGIQFNFNPQFIGLLDMMRQIGKLGGLIWFLLMPLKKPKRDYFIFTSLKCMMLLMMMAGGIFGDFKSIFFCLLMGIVGILKSVGSCPHMLVSKKFDPNSQKFIMSLWVALTSLGEIIGVMIGEVLINQLHLHWQIFLIIFYALLFSSCLIFYVCLDELQIEYEEIDICSSIKEKLGCIKEVMLKPNRSLVVIENVLFALIYFSLVLWFPYYFNFIGFNKEANYLSIIFPLTYTIGPIIFQFLIQPFEHYSNQIFIIFLSMNAGISIWLAILGYQQQTQNLVNYYFILLIVQGFVFSPPATRVGMNEISLESQGNQRLIYYMFMTLSLLLGILTTGVYYGIGAIINKDSKLFFPFMMIFSIILLIVSIIRRTFFMTPPLNGIEVQSSDSD